MQDHSVAEALAAQSASAHHIGSPLYASLLGGLLADFEAGGITAELLDGVTDRPMHDAIPLRYLATAHRLALAGQAPTLAQYYGSCAGNWHGEEIASVFLGVVAQHREEFRVGLRRNVQTNEVGRAPALASGFALIASRHMPELDMLEIGSSAGLLSLWDHYSYDTGESQLGDSTSPLHFDRSWWADRAPRLRGDVTVVNRRASDIHPIDPSTTEGRLTMLSFVWPDQAERVGRLRAALDVAARFPVSVDRADAGIWLAEHLDHGPRTGVATVVFHSIVWQYLPIATRDRIRAALAHSGRQATSAAPLLWLRMEPATSTFANLRLTTWPGGADEVLAEVGYHGADIRWLADN